MINHDLNIFTSYKEKVSKTYPIYMCNLNVVLFLSWGGSRISVKFGSSLKIDDT